MYEKELGALKRAGRFRKRRIYDRNLKDFASNDYLGLAHDPKLLENAYKRVSAYGINASKASMLINGYTPIHQEFEEDLAKTHGFEAGIVVGSGFLANIALIEALVRKTDRLFIDAEFHASGNLAARLVPYEVFSHNDPNDLEKRLQKGGFKRAIIAVEGIYSMSGDRLNEEIFEVADRYGALLIVDEAHSSGVVGENLLGVFDGKEINERYIKMGTLGKAYASYGAYILASKEIVSFLENRAKSIIYTTALSLMDVALAHEAFKTIQANKERFRHEIAVRQQIIKRFGKEIAGLIVDFAYDDVLSAQQILMEKGYLVGAIRPPTVPEPMIRVIARVGESVQDLERLLGELSDVCS